MLNLLKAKLRRVSASARHLSLGSTALLRKFVIPVLAATLIPAPLLAATNLTLASGLSFTDDSSPNFPIRAQDAADGTIATDRPTLIFIGTSHCWNTAREAERVVSLYPKYKDKVHFVVIDLNDTSPTQRLLVAKFYRGYIPTVVIFDGKGDLIYDQAGETSMRRGDDAKLDALIKSAL